VVEVVDDDVGNVDALANMTTVVALGGKSMRC
jgi:hypothetical protein